MVSFAKGGAGSKALKTKNQTAESEESRQIHLKEEIEDIVKWKLKQTYYIPPECPIKT